MRAQRFLIDPHRETKDACGFGGQPIRKACRAKWYFGRTQDCRDPQVRGGVPLVGWAALVNVCDRIQSYNRGGDSDL